MLTIFTKEFIDDNEENKARIYAESRVGILEPIPLFGGENQYYIVPGLEWDGKVRIAPNQLVDDNGNFEDMVDYKSRLKPISIQGFYDLSTEKIDAIELSHYQLRLLLQAPEFMPSNDVI